MKPAFRTPTKAIPVQEEPAKLPLDLLWVTQIRGHASRFGLWNCLKALANLASWWLLRKWVVKASDYYLTIRPTLATVLSSRIPEKEEGKRHFVCANCPALITRDGDPVCGASESKRFVNLEYRNAKAGWKCPLKKHEGKYTLYHDHRYGKVMRTYLSQEQEIETPVQPSCGHCKRNSSKNGVLK